MPPKGGTTNGSSPFQSDTVFVVRDLERLPVSETSGNHDGVLLADGSVKFVTDSIDTGDLEYPAFLITAGQESPYGVWTASGKRITLVLLE